MNQFFNELMVDANATLSINYMALFDNFVKNMLKLTPINQAIEE